MTTQTTQRAGARTRKRSAMLAGLALGVVLAGVVTLAGVTPQAEAAFSSKMVFVSDRTTGTGVNNPTGDYEVFRMNPDGTGVRQLTFNEVDDYNPTLSPDGRKIAYETNVTSSSNREGDWEIYSMNATDGKGKKNLTDNGADVDDELPLFSPSGGKLVYESNGIQPSNLEGDEEIYRMNTLDGSGKRNLTNNGSGVDDFDPDFSLNGAKVSYTSEGAQSSNPEGDQEIYSMNILDGKDKKNLTHNDSYDFDPDWGV